MIANFLSLSRIFFAPLFPFLFFSVPQTRFAFFSFLLFFLLLESTDWMDGYYARKTGTVSDVGKLLDPFADALLHLTIFFTLSFWGILPITFFLIIMYREISVYFVRSLLLLKKSTVQGALIWGKLKTVFYFLVCFQGIIFHFFPSTLLSWLLHGTAVIAAVLSLYSFYQYLKILFKKNSI